MGKKRQRHDWPEAKKLCRLNQNDIAMAKALGFGPDTLIRNIPSPSQKWKAPVKYWVQQLYEKRFGHVLGAPPESPPPPLEPLDEDEIKRIEEEIFWEDYWDRNSDPDPPKKKVAAKPSQPAKAVVAPSTEDYSIWPRVDDPDFGDDVPF